MPVPVPSPLIAPSHPVKYDGRTSSGKPTKDRHDQEIVADGLNHIDVKLDPRQYKTSAFAHSTLQLLQLINLPSWNHSLEPPLLNIFKVSGSLTNAVFFVSHPHARTVLLRVYGPSSGDLISRSEELHILHILSSVYRIGPRIYGTFNNGRVEEYFDSVALTANEIRDPMISSWIGARMAELHGVDLGMVADDSGTGTTVKKNLKNWIPLARDVLQIVDEEYCTRFGLEGFLTEWATYWEWLCKWEESNPPSPRVFAHNDAQYGNLLRLKHQKPSKPPHYQIIVVDFEYAAPNPSAFDIANHFHEWTANYHSATPHLLNPDLYPSTEERRRFYGAYLTARTGSGITPKTEEQMKELDDQVRVWSPSSHAMWAIWGIVQAKEMVLEAKNGGSSAPPEFDYLSYSLCRMECFRRELRQLGLLSTV